MKRSYAEISRDPLCLDDFPPELTHHLLQFLPTEDLCRAATVCWSWRAHADRIAHKRYRAEFGEPKITRSWLSLLGSNHVALKNLSQLPSKQQTHLAVWAAVQGHVRILERLVQERTPFDSQAVLFIAVKLGNLEVLRLLESFIPAAQVDARVSPATPTLLTVAVQQGNPAVLDFLLSKATSPPDLDGMLIFGARCGQLEVAKYLVARGADINASKTRVKNGEEHSITSLTEAVQGNHTNVVNWLLQNGANPNPNASRLCEAPLVSALRHRNSSVVLKLLQHGAQARLEHRAASAALRHAARTCPRLVHFRGDRPQLRCRASLLRSV